MLALGYKIRYYYRVTRRFSRADANTYRQTRPLDTHKPPTTRPHSNILMPLIFFDGLAFSWALCRISRAINYLRQRRADAATAFSLPHASFARTHTHFYFCTVNI